MPSERIKQFTREHLQHHEAEHIIRQYFNLLNEWHGKVNSDDKLTEALAYLKKHGNGVNEFLAQVDLLKEAHDDRNIVRLGWWLVKDYLDEVLKTLYPKQRL